MRSLCLLAALLPNSAYCGTLALGHIPLSFEPGLHNSEFIAHAGRLGVTLSPSGASIGAGRMAFVGARRSAAAQPEEQLTAYTNYLLDPDPRNWRVHVPNYRRVRYSQVYPGIDVIYYGNPRELEFDFIVGPGADARRIRLVLSDPDLRIQLPRVYQGNHTIEARVRRRGRTITFELGPYDRSRALVIDPVVSFATLFGGGGPDEGDAIAVDSTGATYVAGTAMDSNFPIVNGGPGLSTFVAKVNAAGDGLIYSTYLPIQPAGGPQFFAIDPAGSAYLVSTLAFFGTSAPPVIGPAPIHNCGMVGPPHVYVAKLSPDGASMIYSGCIGGTGFETPNGIAVDGSGNAYLAGVTQSPDFPLVNPLSSTGATNAGSPKAFVLKLSPNGSLLYSTYFGGSNVDPVSAIAADPAGNIYVSGRASSPDFPLKNAIQSERLSAGSTFITKIQANGADLVYSTFFGAVDFGPPSAIAADAPGNTYIAGSTTAGGLRTTSNAFQSKFAGVFAYKSSDGGASWNQRDSGLPGGVSALEVDPKNPANLYAISSAHAYKSTNGGDTWQSINPGSADGLWINPSDSTLYVSAAGGGTGRATQILLRSHDGGSTFATVDTGVRASMKEMIFDPSTASVIYARFGGSGTNDGIYKSIDGGDTWKTAGLNGGGTGGGGSPDGLAIDPNNPSILYAATRNGGLQRSYDGGGTWASIGGVVNLVLMDSGSTLYSTIGSLILVLPPGGATAVKTAPGVIKAMSIDPSNSSTWYAVIYGNTPSPSTAIYKTTDAGNNWQPLSGGLPDASNIAVLVIDPSTPETVYVGASASPDGYFAKLSPDGSSLLYATYLGGSGSESVTSIATDASGNTYLIGTTNSTDFPFQGPFRSAVSGVDGFVAKFDSTLTLQWSSPLGGATPRGIATGSAGEVYLTGSASSAGFPTAHSIQPYISSNFFYSTDAGASWTPSSPEGGPTPPQFLIPTVAADPKTASRVYALADRLYVSNDHGQNWTPLGSPTGQQNPFTGSLGSILVLDPLTPATMYAGTVCQFSTNSQLCGVSKSTDGGATWTLYPLGVQVNGPQSFVSGMAIDPKTPSTLYAAANTGIFKSTDAGVTWNAALGVPNASAVAVDAQNPANIYVSFGTNIGSLFKSSDGGVSWTTINTGLPAGWYARTLVATAGRVFAGSSFVTTGFYRSDNGGSNWIKVGSGLPASSIAALAVDPGATSTIYAAPAAGGLYRSSDAGATFTLIPALKIPIVNSIALDSGSSSRIYAGTRFNPQDAFVMKIIP